MITELDTARNADVEVEEPGGRERVVAEVLFERPPADPSPWLLVVPSGLPNMSRVYESLLTVGDGLTGTRGAWKRTEPTPARPCSSQVFMTPAPGALSRFSWSRAGPRSR